MHRIRYATLALALLIGLSSTPASGSVQARVGVRPDTLQHCDHSQFSFALWNDGPDSLRVRLFVALEFDSVTFGPHPLRTRLGPHEVRHRDVDFIVPPGIPSGRYTLRLYAVASDSSRTEASAAFVVLPGGCSDDGGATPQLLMLEAVAQGMGLDTPTPTVHGTWGALKRRYDNQPR